MTGPPLIQPQTLGRRLPEALGLMLAGAALGALVMAISNSIAGHDLAGRLASTLGLESGAVLGTLLGAITGAWLVLGGRRRIAGFTGFAFGIAAAAGLWSLVRAHMWIVNVVLEGAFGAGAGLYSGLAVMVVLYLVIRVVADVIAGTTRKLLERASRST